MLLAEYIWIDSNSNFRSKTRVCEQITDWSFDGSSTDQLSYLDKAQNNTEIILKPVHIRNNPCFITSTYTKYLSLLVWCVCYHTDGSPVVNNYFQKEWMDNEEVRTQLEEIYLGIELEFVFQPTYNKYGKQGRWYCGYKNHQQMKERKVVQEIVNRCLSIDLPLSGMNAEVAPRQWELQLFASASLAIHDFWIMKYIIVHTAQEHELEADFSPKPLGKDYNGSGCHINISTPKTRESIDEIYRILEAAKKTHAKDIPHFGSNNHERLTGSHETSSITEFTYGVGTRNTSVRIPIGTSQNKQGYFEDRRPAANCNIYQVFARWYSHLVN